MIQLLKKYLYLKKKRLKYLPKTFFKKLFWESNSDNLYYGHYNIFKKYSKTFLPYKINGEVQHGWSPLSGIAGEGLHASSYKNKRFYVFNQQNQKKCKRLGYNNVIPIGAPYIYISNLLDNLESFSKNTLIFFPSHSHEWASFSKPIAVFQNYIQNIRKIKSHFKTICVSLGWNEYQNSDLRNLFDKESIEIITMGPRDGNPNFLFNFISTVKKFEYVSSENFSSAIFYSLMINRKTFIYGKLLCNHQNFSEEYENVGEVYLKKYSKLYPELIWKNFEDKTYPEIANKELGLNNKKSPARLRKLFGWSIID